MRNRQRAKLEDFKVGDKINVYGYMDKDNYSVDALIGRNVVSISKPIFQHIELNYQSLQHQESASKTPCDVSLGWVKTERYSVPVQY